MHANGANVALMVDTSSSKSPERDEPRIGLEASLGSIKLTSASGAVLETGKSKSGELVAVKIELTCPPVSFDEYFRSISGYGLRSISKSVHPTPALRVEFSLGEGTVNLVGAQNAAAEITSFFATIAAGFGAKLPATSQIAPQRPVSTPPLDFGGCTFRPDVAMAPWLVWASPNVLLTTPNVVIVEHGPLIDSRVNIACKNEGLD